jgi:hypothetical protein
LLAPKSSKSSARRSLADAASEVEDVAGAYPWGGVEVQIE